MKKGLKVWVRMAIAMCGLLMLTVLYFPIWQIQLDAPQYPEGLVLLISANSLGGSVDIVNGLNHYIGMQTLHASDFIEFLVLPYIITLFSILFLSIAFINRKRLLYGGFILFVLFGIVAMADFWRWEYNYGHELNPEAPIKVPGMAYQPPLIGYKQLLNFGAYSIPDIGGWIFVAVGVILLATVIVEVRTKNTTVVSPNKKTIVSTALLFVVAVVITSCTAQQQPIVVGQDACSFCKMTVSDARFGGEILTHKGKVYKFDDAHCLLTFLHSDAIKEKDIKTVFVVNFDTHQLIPASNAFFYKNEALRTPMNGNIAAFSTAGEMHKIAARWQGEAVNWTALNQ